MASRNLYPPIVPQTQYPWICYDKDGLGSGRRCRIYFSLPKFNLQYGEDYFHKEEDHPNEELLILKNLWAHAYVYNIKTHKNVLNLTDDLGVLKNQATPRVRTGGQLLNLDIHKVKDQTNLYYVNIFAYDLEGKEWNTNNQYKIQLRLSEVKCTSENGQLKDLNNWLRKNANRFSEWSTATIIRVMDSIYPESDTFYDRANKIFTGESRYDITLSDGDTKKGIVNEVKYAPDTKAVFHNYRGTTVIEDPKYIRDPAGTSKPVLLGDAYNSSTLVFKASVVNADIARLGKDNTVIDVDKNEDSSNTLQLEPIVSYNFKLFESKYDSTAGKLLPIKDFNIVERSEKFTLSKFSNAMKEKKLDFIYTYKYELTNGRRYKAVFSFETQHGYIGTVMYVFDKTEEGNKPIPKSTIEVNEISDYGSVLPHYKGEEDLHDKTLKELESEEGFIQLKMKLDPNDFTINKEAGEPIDPGSSLVIRRTDMFHSNYKSWEDLAIIPYEKIADFLDNKAFNLRDDDYKMYDTVDDDKVKIGGTTLEVDRNYNFYYYDKTVESGVFYRYCIEFMNSNEERSEKRKTAIYEYDGEKPKREKEPIYIMREFEHTYLLGYGGQQLKLRLDENMSGYKINVNEMVQPTINSKYPYVIRTGESYYKTFNIGGTISFQMDDNEIFLNFDGKHDNNLHSLYKGSQTTYNELIKYKNKNRLPIEYMYDRTYERMFREKVVEFLLSDRPILYKSPTEGNVLIRLTNVSFNPNNKIGNLVYSFSATATEIAECNIDNYRKYKFC